MVDGIETESGFALEKDQESSTSVTDPMLARVQQKFPGIELSIDVNRVLTYHALVCIVVGGAAFLLPHGLASSFFGGEYGHFLHEVVRMYGALTLAQGWLTIKTRQAGDARVKRAMSEAYAISYGLQAAALLRAHWSSPSSHSYVNLICILAFSSLSAFYGFCRWGKNIKVFELPTERDQTQA